jgi:hypothetical protein
VLIIIEGADCSRKSTLARRVQEHLDHYWYGTYTVRQFHRGAPRKHPLDEYELPLLTYRPTPYEAVICDRWHLGELVYPTLFGRPSLLDEPVRRHVELFLRSRGAVVALLTEPDDAELASCLRTRGDALVSPTQALRARDLFLGVQTSLPLLSMEPRAVDDAAVDRLIYEARDHASRARNLTSLTTYVGAPNPGLLLVGDRRGTTGEPSDHGDWPAFVPRGGTSGNWLLSALASTHYDRVGLVNACDVDDVYLAWDVLGRPPAVALGRNAEAECRRRGVPTLGTVAHPQHWRRFRHRDRAEFNAELTALVSSVDVVA